MRAFDTKPSESTKKKRGAARGLATLNQSLTARPLSRATTSGSPSVDRDNVDDETSPSLTVNADMLFSNPTPSPLRASLGVPSTVFNMRQPPISRPVTSTASYGGMDDSTRPSTSFGRSPRSAAGGRSPTNITSAGSVASNLTSSSSFVPLTTKVAMLKSDVLMLYGAKEGTALLTNLVMMLPSPEAMLSLTELVLEGVKKVCCDVVAGESLGVAPALQRLIQQLEVRAPETAHTATQTNIMSAPSRREFGVMTEPQSSSPPGSARTAAGLAASFSPRLTQPNKRLAFAQQQPMPSPRPSVTMLDAKKKSVRAMTPTQPLLASVAATVMNKSLRGFETNTNFGSFRSMVNDTPETAITPPPPWDHDLVKMLGVDVPPPPPRFLEYLTSAPTVEASARSSTVEDAVSPGRAGGRGGAVAMDATPASPPTSEHLVRDVTYLAGVLSTMQSSMRQRLANTDAASERNGKRVRELEGRLGYLKGKLRDALDHNAVEQQADEWLSQHSIGMTSAEDCTTEC